MATASSSTFTVQIVAAPPPPTKSFQLISPAGGPDLPFSLGYGFTKGDIPDPTTLTLDAGTAQVVVKRRWNDNSVKHAIISGHITLVGNVAKDIQVVAGAPAGTALTSADIVIAAPTASVTCGAAANTVQLATLLATPFRTWISGPEMVECHYRAPVPNDATLVVWFHVRLYRLGRIWIRAFCENGFVTDSLDGNGLSSAIDKSYVPSVSIDGPVVYNNGGASLTHYGHTRWDVEGWIGGDPQITPRHNVTQLIATKLVPNYWKRNPTSAGLDPLFQAYTPMAQGDWTLTMGDTGAQTQIGLLPLWDSLYCTSGDPRAFRSMVANARALNGYGIVWREPAGGDMVRPSVRSTWTLHGNNGGGGGFHEPVTGARVWDTAHHGSGGYLAYLVTGDYYHLETMQHQASVVYLASSQGEGAGTSRLLRGQSRGMAWSLRTVGQLAAIGPSGDSVVSEYVALLASNMAFWDSERQRPGQNQLGILYSFDLATNAYFDQPPFGVGSTATWQQNFIVQTLGHLRDLEPLPVPDMTSLIAVGDFYYRWPVGLLGTNGPTNYCYNYASAYTIKVANVQTSDVANCFDTWGEVFQATYLAANGTCGTALLGGSGGDPQFAREGYWGNLIPAIAYAVDYGATDALGAFARMTGASNWSTIENSGFDNMPIWGIVPRGTLGT